MRPLRRFDRVSDACSVLAMLLLAASAMPSFADDATPTPNKSGYTLFDPTPDADLRSFNTDGVQTRGWTVFDPTLKLGLTNTIDAELQVTPYESAVTQTAAATTRLAGVGDTFARLKVNLLGDDGGAVALAVLPYVKLPTARAGLGNGKVEGGLILPVSLSAPGGFTVIVMPEADYLKDSAQSGYHGAFDFLVNVSHPLDKRWTVYSEIFTSQSLQTGEPTIYTLDAALTCALTAALQLDLGGNFSLNGVSPRAQLYTGLSQRF